VAHLTAAIVKKPAKKGKAGQSAKDAVKAAAKQRRQDKQSVKPESPPWDDYNRKGREVSWTLDPAIPFISYIFLHLSSGLRNQRQDKPCVKPQSLTWDKQDRMGREVNCSDLLTCTLKGQLYLHFEAVAKPELHCGTSVIARAECYSLSVAN